MRFCSIEAVLPTRAITNDDIVRSLREASGRYLSAAQLRSVERKTRAAFRSMGTKVRYYRQPDERPSELCAHAARRALQKAKVGTEEIDLLIYVGVGRGFLEPATAYVFQDLLGLRNATRFDILDACASWLRGIQIARSFIEGGTYRTALVLNAEFSSELEWYGSTEPIWWPSW